MTPSSRTLRTLVLASGLALQTPVLGQDGPEETPPPSTDNPALTDRSLDEVMSQRTSRPTPGEAIAPSRAPEVSQVVPNTPADPSAIHLATGSILWTDAQTLMPEGTFLVRRAGEVVRLRTGGLAFLPSATEDGSLEPAIALLPSESYSRLETLLGEEDRSLWVALTGEVFKYRGRNFVLPAVFAMTEAPIPEMAAPEADVPIESAPEADLPEPETAPETEPENQPATQPDTRIDDLVRELEAQRQERRGIDTTFPEEPAASAAPAGPRVEGRMLLGRRARMVRTGAGGWAISIDNDADAGSSELPALLRLHPGSMVEQMERQAERRGDGWSFEISGSLHAHGGSVYIVPRMFVSLPDDEVRAMQ